jgi:hypothetical protein
VTKHLKLPTLLVIAVQVAFLLPASAQQSQPIGTANTIGTVSNFNGTNASSSSNATNTFSSNSRPVILLPNGTRRSTSVSTVTVCDNFSGGFPDEVDVCSLK